MIGLNGGLIGGRRVPSPNSGLGVWTLDEQVTLERAGSWIDDPYFNSVSLLAHMNGADNSTSFIDSSKNRFAAVVYGNSKISTVQSKFEGTSGYFDGVGDMIVFPNAAHEAFGFGTGDFTVEFWHYYQGGNGYVCMLQIAPPSGNYLFYGLNTGTKNPFIWNNTNVLTTTFTVTNNVWQHHAIVRSNGVVYVLIDGTIIGAAPWAVSLGSTATAVIGANGGNTQNTTGYIDEVRITKGIARYVPNFTVPTVSFPDAGTSDIFFNSVSLLLHMDGSNGSTTFTDNSSNALTVTANGNAQISTAQSKFGGSSALFDGTTDYLTVASSAAFALFAGDFTVEFWMRLNDTTNNQSIVQLSSNSVERANISVVSNLIVLYTETGGSGATRISSAAPSTGTWHHVAWTRDGTTSRLFLNGTSVGTASSAPYPSGNMAVSIGANDRSSGGTCVDGYIDDLRITKGVARYTANFAVPDAPFPNG